MFKYFGTSFHAFSSSEISNSLLSSFLVDGFVSYFTAKKYSITCYYHKYIRTSTCAHEHSFPELPHFCLRPSPPSVHQILSHVAYSRMRCNFSIIKKKIRTRQNKNKLITLFPPLSRYHSNSIFSP